MSYDFVVGDSDPDEVLDGEEEIDAEFALELGQSYHWYKVSLARTYLTEQSGYKWVRNCSNRFSTLYLNPLTTVPAPFPTQPHHSLQLTNPSNCYY